MNHHRITGQLGLEGTNEVNQDYCALSCIFTVHFIALLDAKSRSVVKKWQ